MISHASRPANFKSPVRNFAMYRFHIDVIGFVNRIIIGLEVMELCLEVIILILLII